MSLRSVTVKIVHHEALNFLLTNRMPRRLVTRWIGWFSRIEQRMICAVSIRVWRFFTDLDLSDAQEVHFKSLHHCFTRRLKEGSRPVQADADVLVSPCDAIVGAMGTVRDKMALQVKGMPYPLSELLGDDVQADAFCDGVFVTLRLNSAMYHHFHAPHDCRVTSVSHFFGDAWNVNRAALLRVDRLFCKNERAVVRLTLARTGHQVTLVAVAAILVSGIRLCFVDLGRLDRRRTRRHHSCDVVLHKGDEMGWFEHGSTILVFAPSGFMPCPGVWDGSVIRAGQALLHLPGTTS